MKKSTNLARFIIKTIILKLIFFNGVMWSQTGGSEIFSKELNKLLALRDNSLSGLTLEGEEVPRSEFREYYYNKFMELSETFSGVGGLSEEEKTYLSSFAKLLGSDVLVGFPREKGIEIKKIKPVVLPTLENVQKKMESIIEKYQSPPSEYQGLLAGVVISQATLSPFPGNISKLSQGKKLLEEAIKKDPDNYPSIIGLSLSYYFPPALFGGSFNKSVELLERVINSPSSRKTYKYLAYIWLSQNWVKKKDFEKTKFYLDKAREIFPQGGLLLYADLLLKSKKRIGG